MSQVASAQPASSRSVVAGRAEVVKSRSLCSRPSMASRTGPPTSAICSPAPVNLAPSSSMTGDSRSSSRTAVSWTSRMLRPPEPGGAVRCWRDLSGGSDTRGNSMPEPSDPTPSG